MADQMQTVEYLEIDLLLEGVYRRFGQDFRGYRRENVRQRLHALTGSAGARLWVKEGHLANPDANIDGAQPTHAG